MGLTDKLLASLNKPEAQPPPETPAPPTNTVETVQVHVSKFQSIEINIRGGIPPKIPSIYRPTDLGREFICDGWHGIPCSEFSGAMKLAGNLSKNKAGQFIRLNTIIEPDGHSNGVPLIRLRDYSIAESAIPARSDSSRTRKAKIFLHWSARITLAFNTDALTITTLGGLLITAGRQVGIGFGSPGYATVARRLSGFDDWGLFEVRL